MGGNGRPGFEPDRRTRRGDEAEKILGPKIGAEKHPDPPEIGFTGNRAFTFAITLYGFSARAEQAPKTGVGQFLFFAKDFEAMFHALSMPKRIFKVNPFWT